MIFQLKQLYNGIKMVLTKKKYQKGSEMMLTMCLVLLRLLCGLHIPHLCSDITTFAVVSYIRNLCYEDLTKFTMTWTIIL